jgi:hypothetical protein
MKVIVERDREPFSKIMIKIWKSEYAFQICFTFCISVYKNSKYHWNWLLVETELCTGVSGIYLFLNDVYVLTLWDRLRFEMFITVWLITPPFMEPKVLLPCLQYSSTEPEIQQNESSPSNYALFWHSFLCISNLPKCSFVVFSLPKLLCAYHISHAYYKLRPFHLHRFDHSLTVMSRAQITKFLVLLFPAAWLSYLHLRTNFFPNSLLCSYRQAGWGSNFLWEALGLKLVRYSY